MTAGSVPDRLEGNAEKREDGEDRQSPRTHPGEDGFELCTAGWLDAAGWWRGKHYQFRVRGHSPTGMKPVWSRWRKITN